MPPALTDAIATYINTNPVIGFAMPKTERTLVVGFDNAGGVTLEVTDEKWSAHYSEPAVAAHDAVEILTGVELAHDGSQWDEGVRATECTGPEQHYLTVSDVYDLALQLRARPATGYGERVFRGEVERTETIKAHSRVDLR